MSFRCSKSTFPPQQQQQQHQQLGPLLDLTAIAAGKKKGGKGTRFPPFLYLPLNYNISRTGRRPFWNWGKGLFGCWRESTYHRPNAEARPRKGEGGKGKAFNCRQPLKGTVRINTFFPIPKLHKSIHFDLFMTYKSTNWGNHCNSIKTWRIQVVNCFVFLLVPPSIPWEWSPRGGADFPFQTG